MHHAFSDNDRAFIDAASMFFLATVDPDGWPDCSYKGGVTGFVKVIGPSTIVFPSYDGNGQFRSLGNISLDAKVALLFINFEHPDRMRVHGTATLHDDPELLAGFDGAQLVVRVEVTKIFPNCPRYIHKMQPLEQSVYAPRPGHVPPVPEWKQMDIFKDYLPASRGEGN